jgi:pimeloyl-ACP methyl ester carboxylesterase
MDGDSGRITIPPALEQDSGLMTLPPAPDNQLGDADPRSPGREPHVGRARRRRRRIIAATLLPTVVGLLLGNAAMVDRQDADATGNQTLPLDGGSIYVRQDGPRDARHWCCSTGWAARPAGGIGWRVRTDGLLRKSLSTAFTPRFQIPQQLVDDVHGMPYHALTAASRASDDYLKQRPLPDRLTAVGKPLLVIFGEQEQRWRPASAALYRAVAGASVELLPGVGHSPMLEDPPRTAALLRTFTSSVLSGQ